MKKTISLILCIVLTASLFVTTAFAEDQFLNFQKTLTYTDGKFTDVSSSDWFSMNVKAAYEYGLMNGETSSSFGPNDNVTIAQLITLAARLRSIYMGGSTYFDTSTPWYQTYVSYAIANGIIDYNQYSDYTAVATRSQFAQIFAAALPSVAMTAINTISIGDIPDVPLTGSYQSIYTLYKAGIVTGNSTAGEFKPTTNITRGEVAAVATRMANEALRIKFTIIKAGNANVKTMLQSTVDVARDEIALALESYNGAYSSALSSYYSSAATSMDEATTYLQMAAQYCKTAAEVSKANSKYSATYANINSAYLKSLEAIKAVSALTSASCSLSADWDSARALMNDCDAALLKAYVAINDIG